MVVERDREGCWVVWPAVLALIITALAWTTKTMFNQMTKMDEMQHRIEQLEKKL